MSIWILEGKNYIINYSFQLFFDHKLWLKWNGMPLSTDVLKVFISCTIFVIIMNLQSSLHSPLFLFTLCKEPEIKVLW